MVFRGSINTLSSKLSTWVHRISKLSPDSAIWVQIFSNLPDLSWICENFSFLWPKNKKCCCFWRFQSKLAVPGRYRVKFLRQRTLDDEDTADWREIFIFETFWFQIFNISKDFSAELHICTHVVVVAIKLLRTVGHWTRAFWRMRTVSQQYH